MYLSLSVSSSLSPLTMSLISCLYLHRYLFRFVNHTNRTISKGRT
jgi:hypothetical protein